MATHETSLSVAGTPPVSSWIHTGLSSAVRAQDEEVAGELAATLDTLLQSENLAAASDVYKLAEDLLSRVSPKEIPGSAPLLIRACVYLFNIGRSTDAITLGRKIAAVAEMSDDILVQRRIYNVLGWHYGDIADFTAAIQCLQTSLALAKQIRDPRL